MRISSLTLSTGNLELLRHFYKDVLGLPVLDDVGGITVQAGLSQLRFVEHAKGNSQYHFAFNIREDRLPDAIEWLKARGVGLIRDSSGQEVYDFASWNAHAAYFYDPAGNVVEFIARHDLAPSNSDGPLTTTDILSVSEIGLPSDDPVALGDRLSRELGVGYYRPPAPDFRPLGDEEGLFIIVQRGRPWYPETGVLANDLPVSVTVTKNSDDAPYELNLPLTW